LEARLRQRAAAGEHFMPPSLLDSQLQALQFEEQELLLRLAGTDATQPPGQLMEAILCRLGAAGQA